ncbi:unnamed protein product, partial [Schistocephalus solidus]|uniref:Reverse transcriptase domain-containing protein n=1 Tax=Schistocephalus solidus TaxID=70667 RepID=A0A183SC41_SCHSO
MRTHVYTNFVDLMKAFATVNRDGLWKIMQKFGCPKGFTHLVHQLHVGMRARVTDNGTVSKAFSMTNGVKQSCVLAPTLFSLMFSYMSKDAYREERLGIRIAYQMDGRLIYELLMYFCSCVFTVTILEFFFADEAGIFGLCINTEKTVVMHQPLPNTTYSAAQINVNGSHTFTYLGSNLSRSFKVNDEIAHRIAKAS